MFNPEKNSYNQQERPMQPEMSSEKNFEIRAKSIASELHPDRNEDAIFQVQEKNIFGVFDGMGGENAGEIASRLARDYIAKSLQNLPDKFSLQQTQEELKNILKKANEKILHQTERNPEQKGMGTTASVVKIFEGDQGEKKAIIGNVGDSRVYVYRVNGQLEQITLDDNIVRQAVKDEQQARIVQNKLNNVINPNILSPKEQMLFKHRNQISQALGMNGIEPNIYTISIRAGEKLVVTSDGIHDNLTDKEIAQILDIAQDNQKAIEDLINTSQNRSRKQHPRAKSDDMSAIVVEFPVSIGSKKAEQASQSRSMEVRERKISISEAKDFLELFKAIESTGGLQGSKKFYKSAELKRMINQVRTGELPLEVITRANGLRWRVRDLLKLERLRKKIG